MLAILWQFADSGYTWLGSTMGFFFRRSTNFGPFRLNFSKSGIGASVGVKGARLTMTPRGTTYITVGGDGFYYRETLSNRGGSPPDVNRLPPFVLPTSTLSSTNEIGTADVADLVDSSSETLIQRLNERAKMFNPAWLLYALAFTTAFYAVMMSSPPSDDPELPDVSSPFSPERSINSKDEYSILVTRYGYPNSVLASDAIGTVLLRTASFDSVHVTVAFVPNGCVRAYEEILRANAEKARYPALTKQKTTNVSGCAVSPVNGWTIVQYGDSSEDQRISAAFAKYRLDTIKLKQEAPPVLRIEGDAASTKKSTQRSRSKIVPKLQSDAKSKPQIWALSDQTRKQASAVDSWKPYAMPVVISGALSFFIVGIIVHRKNTEKRTSRLFFELDESHQQKYSIVREALTHLGKSHRIWRIEARSATSDWKRNAGASTLIRRSPISVGVASPPRVETNLAIPSINLGAVKLFFLPDVILYLERGTYGGIGYDAFCVEQNLTRFIEDEHVPSDATVVDRTWRFVNKGGGPDRRFNNNVQLPVVQYGVLLLKSSRGLNIHLNTSNAQESLAFANCWRSLRSHVGTVERREGMRPSEPELPTGPRDQALKMLGLNADASPDEISNAYRRLAQMYHPDKVAGLASEFQTLADSRMKEINGAYQLLKQTE